MMVDSGSPTTIELTDTLEVVLKDGAKYHIKPGPYGKGLSVVPILPKIYHSRNPYKADGGGDGRGRPPRPSTLELREKLKADGEAGAIHPTGHYLEWLLEKDDDLAEATARSIVYRERRAALEAYPGAEIRKGRRGRRGGETRGRKPSPATLKLRERLEADAREGSVQDPQFYIKWLIDQDKEIGLKQARPIVYRERRQILEANPTAAI